MTKQTEYVFSDRRKTMKVTDVTHIFLPKTLGKDLANTMSFDEARGKWYVACREHGTNAPGYLNILDDEIAKKVAALIGDKDARIRVKCSALHTDEKGNTYGVCYLTD